MRLSNNVVKAMAVGDMCTWISKFKPDNQIYQYDEETQKKYQEYIERIVAKIYREL